MGQAVIHFEVAGKNAEKLQSFYSDLFDWDIDADNEMNYGIVGPGGQGGYKNAQGNGIAGGVGPAPEGSPGHVTFYVEVEDVAAALEKAESLGATTVLPESSVMEGVVIGLFNDPEGHMVGVVKAQPA
jgi:uncharacterized protein